ncbi:hypothetical protein ES703_93862 [subsurface metagenome]
MKTKFKDGILTLRAENEEEQKFLRTGFDEGLRNFGGGSTNLLALPSLAGLKQVHFKEGQLKILAYALHIGEEKLNQVFGRENVFLTNNTILEVK